MVFICPNTPPLLEAHFAVPMIGAVLVCVNTHLSAPEYRYIIDHSDAKAVFVDNEFAGQIQPIADELDKVTLFVNICEYTCASASEGAGVRGVSRRGGRRRRPRPGITR